ncbi:MAG: sigma-70 family RNA polymerase sigma factor [Planctomycetota bacterium]
MSEQRNPITIEALLHHAGWVRDLARRLVLDESQADDVVQQTWLAALRNPPKPGRAARAWLARVVRNIAFRTRRDEARLKRREQQVPAETMGPPADQVVEEVASLRMVVEAVLRLEEPYRSTVLLRYFKDLDSQEIAEQTGVPPATVRTRLHRGLALLRAELTRTAGGSWCLALLPLLGKQYVASAAAASTAVAGGVALAVKTKVAVIIAVAATVALVTWQLTRTTQSPSPTEDSAGIATGEPATGTSRPEHADDEVGAGAHGGVGRSTAVTGETGEDQAPTTSSSVAAPDATTAPVDVALYGQLVGLSAVAPWTAKLEILAIHFADGDWPYSWPKPPITRERTVAVESGGSFPIDLRSLVEELGEIDELWIHGDDPAYLPLKTMLVSKAKLRKWMESPPPSGVRVQVTPASMIRGQVVGEDGLPVPGAAVAVYAVENDAPRGVRRFFQSEPLRETTAVEPLDQTFCKADGSYRLRATERGPTRTGSFAIVAAVDARKIVTEDESGQPVSTWLPSPGLRPAVGSVSAIPPSGRDCELLVLFPGLSISGTVTGPDASPIAGATVSARRVREGDAVPAARLEVECYDLDWVYWQVSHASVAAKSNEDGTFSIGGLEAGEYDLLVEAVEDRPYLAARQETRRVQAAASDILLVLDSQRLIFRVTERGSAVSGARVLLGSRDPIEQVTNARGEAEFLVAPSRRGIDWYAVHCEGFECVQGRFSARPSDDPHRIEVRLKASHQRR